MAQHFAIRNQPSSSVPPAPLFASEDMTLEPNMPPGGPTIIGMPKNEDARLFFPSEHPAPGPAIAETRTPAPLFTYAPPSTQQFFEPAAPAAPAADAFGISPVQALRQMGPLMAPWRRHLRGAMVGPILVAAGLVGLITSREDATPLEDVRPSVSAAGVAATSHVSPPPTRAVDPAPPPAPSSRYATTPVSRTPSTAVPIPPAAVATRKPVRTAPTPVAVSAAKGSSTPLSVSASKAQGLAAAPRAAAPPTLMASGNFIAPALASTVEKLNAPPVVPDATATAVAAPVPVTVPAPAAAARSLDVSAVESILARYRSAFAALDVNAVKAFWPSVDTTALGTAFSQLQLQKFDFDKCQIDITGPRANAACAGTARFVTKIGAKNIRAESRRWTFHLIRIGGTWIMEGVESR